MKTSRLTKLNSYLSFKLGEETFGVNVGSVLSILKMIRITKIPCAPDYLRGVINLRGEVLPVIDLRLRLGMAGTQMTMGTCILVMELRHKEIEINVGIMVDSVSEVHTIEPNEILAPPFMASKFRTEFIEGMYKDGEGFIMLLEMNNIFNNTELDEINSSIQKIEAA